MGPVNGYIYLVDWLDVHKLAKFLLNFKKIDLDHGFAQNHKTDNGRGTTPLISKGNRHTRKMLFCMTWAKPWSRPKNWWFKMSIGRTHIISKSVGLIVCLFRSNFACLLTFFFKNTFYKITH